jgi:hypothetical protein
MGWKKALGIIVSIATIFGAIFMVFSYYDSRKPVIEYNMFSYQYLDMNYDNYLVVDLQANNRGSIDCYINLQVVVINATILNATIPGLSFQQAQNSIQNNGSLVTILSRLVRKETLNYETLAQIHVQPILGTPQFEIHYTIDIPFSFNYPLGADKFGVVPTDLAYICNENGVYSKIS